MKSYIPGERVVVIWKLSLKKLLQMQHEGMDIMKEKLRDMEDRMRAFNICQIGFLEENNENRKEVNE